MKLEYQALELYGMFLQHNLLHKHISKKASCILKLKINDKQW